jgi:hypothetical protein
VNRYDVAHNRIDIVLDDGGVSSIWWATKNEWLGLIDVAGLEVEALYGDFDRTPLATDSPEYIFVWRSVRTPHRAADRGSESSLMGRGKLAIGTAP